MLAGLLLRFLGQSAAGKLLLAVLAGGVVVGGALLYLHNKFTEGYRAHIAELNTRLRKAQDERTACEREIEKLKLNYEKRLQEYQKKVAELLKKFLAQEPYKLPQNGTRCEKILELLKEFQRRQTSSK